MGLGDLWNRTLVYFGIAEDEEWDEDGYLDRGGARAQLQRAPERAPALAAPARGASSTTGPTRQPAAGRDDDRVAPAAAQRRDRAAAAVPAAPAPARVHLRRAAQLQRRAAIADQFKEGIPVILNLQAPTPSCRSA